MGFWEKFGETSLSPYIQMIKNKCFKCGAKLRRTSFWKGDPVCSDCYKDLLRKNKKERHKKEICPRCRIRGMSKRAKLCFICWTKEVKERKNG